jgi:Protein of unknown function (DUF1549)/Protein of unknown function (DUF1553)
MKPISIITLICLSLTFLTRLTVASESSQRAASDLDALLAKHWQSAGLKPNEPASEETFVRRIYLDLAGRIPTSAETISFLSSKQADKRAALINDLLARESYVSHFYNFWADILRQKSHFVNTAGVVPAAYAKWIKESLRRNKPYDQFVREMLSAKGYCWENGAIGYYGRDPEMPLDNMAITTRIFLGTRIECAQCHDHPFDKWKQTEFYHLAAYTYGNKSVNEALGGVRDAFKAREQIILDDFKREKAASADGGKAAKKRKQECMDAREFRPVLNIIRHGIGQLLSPIAMDRKQDAVLKLPFDFKQDDGKPGDVMSPRPIFGDAAEMSSADDRAEVFARWVTSPGNASFNKVIVNRLWKKLFGVALIEPLDELRDDTKAMLPEVETYLEKLMVEQHYDMRAFLAVIANTRAYQSVVGADEFTRGDVYHFQSPVLRRMTAEQAWDSIVALANHEPDARDLAREARDERRIAISHMVCDAYLNYDGKATVDLGYASLASEKAIQTKEKVARDAEIVAKRQGDKTRETELRREIGRLERERNEAYVRDFLTPLITNLAQKKAGPDAKVTVDEAYKMNTNPAVFAVETWRKMHVPGYGPAPKNAAQLEAEAATEKRRLTALAARLGFADKQCAEFIAYCTKANSEWLRASELDSPAPRGHFLRTMGQSDRDFVENANPNASIPQALTLMNGDLISAKGVLSPYSPLMLAIANASDKVDVVYLALLSRLPTEAEKSLSPAGDATDIARLIYALLNTKQFIFIQ